MMHKTKLQDLAVTGGTPAFGEKLHVGRPNLGDRENVMADAKHPLELRAPFSLLTLRKVRRWLY